MSPRVRTPATLDLEREIWDAAARAHPGGTSPLIAGVDEVGRGALAGPVSVGVAVVGPEVCAPGAAAIPLGLTDSKLLRAVAREELVAPVEGWVRGVAVGHASPAEIDERGIIAALRLAGTRALAELAERGLVADLVLLDGTHDWLTPPAQSLLDAPSTLPDALGSHSPPVRTVVKGDARCASIAAASVVAKVTRDALMTALPDPGYGFAAHKGYGTAAHRAAIECLGVSAHHRRSWRLGAAPRNPGAEGA